MFERKIAVVARHFGMPLKEAFRLSAEIGAEGIQLDARNEIRSADLSETGRRQLVRQLENNRLKLSSLEFLPSKSICEPNRLEARIDALKAAMQLAYELKSKVLVTRIGEIPSDDDPDFLLLVDLLNDLARTGNRVGCSLALLPSRNDPAQFLRLFEKTDAGAIGLCFDPVSFFLAGSDAVEALHQLHQRILTLRVRDAIYDVDGEREEVPLGRGEIAWDEIVGLMDQTQYRDWWTVCRTGGNDRTGDVSRAICYLRGISSE